MCVYTYKFVYIYFKEAYICMYIKYFSVKCCNSKIWGLDDDFEGQPLNLSGLKQSF